MTPWSPMKTPERIFWGIVFLVFLTIPIIMNTLIWLGGAPR